MKVLVVDNYDSFTYNLVQYFGELGAEPIVIRNDELSPSDAALLKPDRLVISPGPGTPEDTGYSVEYLRTIGAEVPTFTRSWVSRSRRSARSRDCWETATASPTLM